MRRNRPETFKKKKKKRGGGVEKRQSIPVHINQAIKSKDMFAVFKLGRPDHTV